MVVPLRQRPHLIAAIARLAFEHGVVETVPDAHLIVRFALSPQFWLSVTQLAAKMSQVGS